jgi:hypothetical protein
LGSVTGKERSPDGSVSIGVVIATPRRRTPRAVGLERVLDGLAALIERG